MRAPEGTLISYATQPGNVAADGITSNSPYTAALAEAMRRPVTLTQRKKPRLVLLSIEEFARLKKLDDPRKAYKVGEMPDDDFADFERGVAIYLGGGDEE